MRQQKSRTLPLVMIADDDEDERCLLKAILKLMGFSVLEAADGQEAISLAMKRIPDLLLVELELPRVSGSAVIRQIKKRADLRDLPIAVVSLGKLTRRSKQPLIAGSTAHLEKPLNLLRLTALIDRLVPGHSLPVV